jgi:RNA polymerase sigma-70 factor (ECF subfamily)
MEMQLGLCYKYLQDRGKAEDAVMSIFEELIEKVKRQKIEKFDKWLHVLSKNHCLMALRKENKKSLTVIYDSDLMQNEGDLHPEDDWFEEDLDEEMLKKLEFCLKKLPDEQQSCIRQHYFMKKSYKEIANFMNKDSNKIRSYIQNGRRNLKNCIERKE